MTGRLRGRGVTTILLDIEGTTTPMAFVHDVLFPFARAQLRAYVNDPQQAADVDEAASAFRAEHAADVVASASPPLWHEASHQEVLDSVEVYARWLMDRDRKSPALKLLQGRIWDLGYRAGLLRGQVFADTAPAMRRWRDAGVEIAIYSSGSVLAQRRLFESTLDGDLTGLLGGFFDTATGAKTSSRSYRQIAKVLGRAPHDILFISDVTRELTAARTAGLQVLLSIRPGNVPQPAASEFDHICSFDEL